MRANAPGGVVLQGMGTAPALPALALPSPSLHGSLGVVGAAGVSGWIKTPMCREKPNGFHGAALKAALPLACVFSLCSAVACCVTYQVV